MKNMSKCLNAGHHKFSFNLGAKSKTEKPDFFSLLIYAAVTNRLKPCITVVSHVVEQCM